MLKMILLILVIITVSAVIGFDSCTCGYGSEIRQNIKELVK